MNFQAPLRYDLPDKSPLDHRLANQRVGVQKISLFLNYQPPIRSVILGCGLCDAIIPQIHMAAAALAHSGFCRQRYVQFCPALKTEDSSLLNDRLWRFADWPNRFLQTKVLAALLADRRVSTSRLRLYVPALRANNRNRL